MNIVFGIFGVILGILYVRYNAQITRATGAIGWAENHLGGGGTYTLHKIIGVLLIIISIFWMTGSFQWFVANTLGRLFPS